MQTKQSTNRAPLQWHAVLPYAGLLVLMGGLLGAMSLIGFDMGLWGDNLQAEYSFGVKGTLEGMRFFALEHLRRHMLTTFRLASIVELFPAGDVKWYVTSVGLHLLNAFPLYALLNTILRGRWRWLSFSVAALFMVSLFIQFDILFFSTGSGIWLAFNVQLASFLVYIFYVRNERRVIFWRDVSLALFVLSLSLYETNALFFLLYPLLSLAESVPKRSEWRTWILTLANDLIWFPVIMVFYYGVHTIFFPSHTFNTNITSGISRSFEALEKIVNPLPYLQTIQQAWTGEWVLVSLGTTAILSLVLFVWRRGSEPFEMGSTRLNMMLLVGLGLIVLPLPIAASTYIYGIPLSFRTMYAATAGSGILLIVLIAWGTNFIPNKTAKFATFALLMGALLGSSFTAFLQRQQQDYSQDSRRDVILAAIVEAIPDIEAGIVEQPHIIMYTDEADVATVQKDLRALDLYLPLWFAIHYDIETMGFDLLSYVEPENRPAFANRHASEIIDQAYMIIEADGVYSTLRPFVPDGYAPSAPENFIIVYYDAATQTAEVVSEVPDDMLERSNIVQKVPIDWQTNFDLLPESDQP